MILTDVVAVRNLESAVCTMHRENAMNACINCNRTLEIEGEYGDGSRLPREHIIGGIRCDDCSNLICDRCRNVDVDLCQTCLKGMVA
jgi:hypothetical protein